MIRDLSNAVLACQLRTMAPGEPLIVEAARRLERMAIAAGACRCIAVNGPRVEFPRLQSMSVRVGANAPVRTEVVTISGLEPGEHRAVDLFGEVVIVQRVPVR